MNSINSPFNRHYNNYEDMIEAIINYIFNGNGGNDPECLPEVYNQLCIDVSIPKIKDEYPQIISEETAYQITSMLEGAVQRGTGRKLKNLNIPLAGKTGTTNKNMDTWFVGYTSKLVVGVFVGFDEPKSLGRYETGAKTSLRIFKSFIKKSIKKEDAMPFKIPKGISFVMVDPDKGIVKELDYNKAIFESFKTSNLENLYSGNFLNEKTRLYDNINPEKIYSFY